MLLLRSTKTKKNQLTYYLDLMLSFKYLQSDIFEELNNFHETFFENFKAIKAVSVNNLEIGFRKKVETKQDVLCQISIL